MKAIAIPLIVMLCLLPVAVAAQDTFVHEQSSAYEWPDDPLVREKLDNWQNLKFGVLLHWGLYAVPGIVESWALCSEDVDWISRYGHTNYQAFKNWYWNDLSGEFNPTQFDPAQWAAAARQAGMKYAVFTTKHHDGFCMFDSRHTDFSIARGPFRNHPKADVARHVFDAFRNEGFMTGAYFSKPDWHNQNYWWDYFATPDRNVNYKIDRHPERWEAFKTYTHNQIGEITSRYGALDILWLDGGWVCPTNRKQDIDMPAIAALARKEQPGLLVVDRTVHGPYENYQTPEQHIPSRQLPYPWESCVTLTTDWGWVPNAKFKDPGRIIAMLIEVVAKGGNLLLGVGPTAEGLFEAGAVQRLQAIGRWLDANGSAIYNTRITPVYHSGNTWFTADKNGRTRYALYAPPEETTVPAVIDWEGNVPAKGSRVTLVATGQQLKWSTDGHRVTVHLPRTIAGTTQSFALRLDTVKE